MGAASIVEICNMALGYAGVNARIGSMTENSPRAQACNTYYEAKLRQLLKKARWSFTIKRKALTALTGAAWTVAGVFGAGDYSQYGQNVYRSLLAANSGNQPDTSPAWWQQVTRDGYGFVYQLPPDLLSPIEVWEKPTVSGVPPLNIYSLDPVNLDMLRAPRSAQRVPYALENADDGTDLQVLLSDLDSAVLKYSAYVTNPVVFPDLFVEVLAWDLSVPLVLALRSEPDKAKTNMGLARLAFGEAWASDNRDQQTDPEPISEFEAAREGRG